MNQYFLHVNSDKTILLLGPDSFSSLVSQHIGSLAINLQPICKDLGICFDQHLNFDTQITQS